MDESPPIHTAGDDSLPPPRAKRPRAAQACDRCRAKKYKYVADLERKVDELTARLRLAEADVTSQHSSRSQKVVVQPSSGPKQAPPPPVGVEATPLSLPRAASTPREDAPFIYEHHDEAGESVGDEISELNHHTNGIEFHGSTSSTALLGHLQKAREPQRSLERRDARLEDPGYSIVSTLHNSSFSPSGTGSAQPLTLREQNYYFEQAHAFINGYFENIHFIHPLIDKEDFLLRAHSLWFNRGVQPEPSFVALYLSILSFGALVRVWDEDRLGGLTRFEWSRKLFGEAQMYLNYLQFSNTLDTVQCLYLMAKICQNELNPNLAYMYLGLAIRTCLAAGFNREVRSSTEQRSEWISKTWW
ncbi:C6 transcription factor [Aspergillus luchuensis]|uniref:C6 transcription factor n=1 Tax=Aspergillus kawachii TaxID=1069201 RepID=A0A146FVI5_ASPKA|nr:C6 transcription factor [Aspergillus luchuensis]